MTNGKSSSLSQSFTLTWLPWVLGGCGLVLYLATANYSLPTVLDWTAFLQQPSVAARYAGYNYQPEILMPVYYFITTPIRLLPPQHVPGALAVFSALCGALALTQLARAVSLLPHDRTRAQREREINRQGLLPRSFSWLPPVLATVVCALGLSMWEQGTNATAEMFDLLLFAYVLRSLLEYRLDQNENRLYRSALVYGAAMTNNLAMIAFFPLYLVALVWTRKLAFFNLKFLGRMALCGLAGLMFYLLLPIVGSFSSTSSLSFWELLSNNVLGQFWLLRNFPRNILLLLSLTSIVPVFLMSIKWSGHSGDASQIGNVITGIAFHLCHLVILLACLWVSLDPDFSPRMVGLRIWSGLGAGPAFLPLYFLAALGIGYYSGYLLLVARPALERFRAIAPAPTLKTHATTAALLLLLVLVPAIQIHRNLPQIQLSNGPLQKQFAARLIEHLPAKGVLISDDPYHFFLTQQALAKQGRLPDYVMLCSPWLANPEYQKYLGKRYPDWQAIEVKDSKEKIPDYTLATAIKEAGKTNSITYLHPSFGYYFESYSALPAGLTMNLEPLGTNSLIAPEIPTASLQINKSFWDQTDTALEQSLAPHVPQPEDIGKLPKFPENYYEKIGLRSYKNRIAQKLAGYYSRSLVFWGVELQRAGDYAGAVRQFELAQQLNPKNVVADINLAFNEAYRSGDKITTELDRPRDDYFGESRTWDQLLNQYGPYDTPALAVQQGYLYVQGNLVHQAATSFDRARHQATNDITSRLWLGQLHLTQNMPDQTLLMVKELREITQRMPSLKTNLSDLFTLEAAAYLVKGQDAIADEIIATNLARSPQDFGLLASACKAYADNHRYTNALDLTERMISLDPENVACWINRGCFEVELTNFTAAITSFSQAINLETNNYRAIFYRAVANLRAEAFDAAQADYEAVQRQFPKEPGVFFGLAEIAYHKGDTNTAILNYESYLNLAPSDSTEGKAVTARLAELKGKDPGSSNPSEAKSD